MGHCSLYAAYFSSNIYIYVNAAIGSSCQVDSECVASSEICLSSECTCALGYEGQSVNDACTACISGHYKSTTGVGTCQQVTAGHYASDMGGIGLSSAATAQTPCSGLTQSDAGATACYNSPTGQPSGYHLGGLQVFQLRNPQHSLRCNRVLGHRPSLRVCRQVSLVIDHRINQVADHRVIQVPSRAYTQLERQLYRQARSLAPDRLVSLQLSQVRGLVANPQRSQQANLLLNLVVNRLDSLLESQRHNQALNQAAHHQPVRVRSRVDNHQHSQLRSQVLNLVVNQARNQVFNLLGNQQYNQAPSPA